MKQQEKLKAAFDSLLQDVNTRIEEVRENITNLTADFRTQVEGQKENLSEYQEKISSRLNELVNVDSIKTNVLAETENFLDEVKVKIDRVFDFIHDSLNTGEKNVEKAAKNVMKMQKSS
ncbi:MAG: hypothetical protein IPN93_10375 [Bacteroidetes bacterium]|nr:hypothetical protein [Bacteroidota bacterium]